MQLVSEFAIEDPPDTFTKTQVYRLRWRRYGITINGEWVKKGLTADDVVRWACIAIDSNKGIGANWQQGMTEPSPSPLDADALRRQLGKQPPDIEFRERLRRIAINVNIVSLLARVAFFVWVVDLAERHDYGLLGFTLYFLAGLVGLWFIYYLAVKTES